MGDTMRRVPERTPWWGVVSSAAAPVLLIGGWTVAAGRQRGGFDSVSETISALAAHGADDRWVMTFALAGLGVCHVTTALALRPARRTGRLVLGVGGIATLAVAAFPLPADDSGSAAHTVAAGVSFVALGAWPLLAGRRGQRRPLTPLSSSVTGAALLGLVGWLFVELAADSDRVGLAERVAAGAEALWPLVAAKATQRLARNE